jgi:ankyrin repeat protein
MNRSRQNKKNQQIKLWNQCSYPISDVIDYGTYSKVREYIINNDDKNINALNELKQTYLHIATLSRNIDAVRVLLDLTDIDRNATDNANNSALSYAVFNNDVRIVDLLLAHPDIDVNVNADGTFSSQNPLVHACRKNSLSIVLKLIKHPKIVINNHLLAIFDYLSDEMQDMLIQYFPKN